MLVLHVKYRWRLTVELHKRMTYYSGWISIQVGRFPLVPSRPEETRASRIGFCWAAVCVGDITETTHISRRFSWFTALLAHEYNFPAFHRPLRPSSICCHPFLRLQFSSLYSRTKLRTDELITWARLCVLSNGKCT